MQKATAAARFGESSLKAHSPIALTRHKLVKPSTMTSTTSVEKENCKSDGAESGEASTEPPELSNLAMNPPSEAAMPVVENTLPEAKESSAESQFEISKVSANDASEMIPPAVVENAVATSAMLLETAAAAAKGNPATAGAEVDATSAMAQATEDAVALAAMQEAATIVMEAQKNDRTGSKRKAEEAISNALPAKKRSTPTRVSWEDRLKQLTDYKQEHGNLLIPIRYKTNPSLGKFVHNTREQYKLYHKQTPEGYKKKCSLTAERIRQLEELGFAWTTERTKQQSEDWQSRLHQLQAFKDLHGHCLVPHGYSDDPSFAEWIHRQRTTYASMLRDAKPNAMVEQRMNQLKDMGFNFTVHSDKWMDHWNQLKDYKEKHGDCQVPTHYAENPKLGRWVHTQRHQRRLQAKGKKSCMTQARIDLLDQLGFSWEVRPSLERPRATWQQRLEELEAFHQKYGHFQVDPVGMPQLHSWCHEQRQRLKLLDKNDGKDVSKRMSPERAEALKAIGFGQDTELLEMKAGRTAEKDMDVEGVPAVVDEIAPQVKEEEPGADLTEPGTSTANGTNSGEHEGNAKETIQKPENVVFV